jgi:hypothetical protein
VVQAEHTRDPAHAEMTRHGDGKLENLDWFQGRAEPLHQLIIDRFVVARESIGILEDELLALGE